MPEPRSAATNTSRVFCSFLLHKYTVVKFIRRRQKQTRLWWLNLGSAHAKPLSCTATVHPSKPLADHHELSLHQAGAQKPHINSRLTLELTSNDNITATTAATTLKRLLPLHMAAAALPPPLLPPPNKRNHHRSPPQTTPHRTTNALATLKLNTSADF